MYFKIIIVIICSGVLISCRNIKQSNTSQTSPNHHIEKIGVYKVGKKVATLLNNTIGSCDDCYIYETVDIFNKNVVFRIPVESNGKRFEKSINFNYKESKDNGILELERKTTYINGAKLFLKNEEKSIINYKYVWYASEQYRKKLAENDYEHVGAIKICTPSSFNYVIKDTLNLEEHPAFKAPSSVDDCFYCELESPDFEACKKIINE